MNVAGEVGADRLGGEGDARRPLADEFFDVCETCVAAGLQIDDEVLCGEVSVDECGGPDSPDSGDPGQTGEFAPERCEIEPEQRRLHCGFDGRAVLASEQCRVSYEECGVICGEHGDRIGDLLDERGLGSVEVLEQDMCVGGRAAAGGVGCDGTDGLESSAGVELPRILYEQKNAADFMQRCDGAAGDDGELWRESCDGNEAEVCGAFVELRGAG